MIFQNDSPAIFSQETLLNLCNGWDLSHEIMCRINVRPKVTKSWSRPRNKVFWLIKSTSIILKSSIHATLKISKKIKKWFLIDIGLFNFPGGLFYDKKWKLHSGCTWKKRCVVFCKYCPWIGLQIVWWKKGQASFHFAMWISVELLSKIVKLKAFKIMKIIN